MRTSRAAIISVLLPCAAYAAVVGMTDRLFVGTAAGGDRQRRAAVAIRDNVTPFQKWGSRLFTLPYLRRNYGEAAYFTQSDSNDCKAAFLSCLDRSLAGHEEVDLFLLAHDNRFVRWVAELPRERTRRIRLVYNTGCRDLRQGPAWLGLGAAAYVGHPGKSASPVFYFFFLRRWTRDVPLDDALDEANRRMRSALVRAAGFSFDRMDADRVYKESEAACHGERHLRISTERE